jgi:hypothetical protein
MKYISSKTLCEVTNYKLHLAITCLSLHSTWDQSPYSLGKYPEYSVLERAILFPACIRDIAGLHLIGTKNILPAGFPGFVQSLQTSGRPSPRPQATCTYFMLMNIILQAFNYRVLQQRNWFKFNIKLNSTTEYYNRGIGLNSILNWIQLKGTTTEQLV